MLTRLHSDDHCLSSDQALQAIYQSIVIAKLMNASYSSRRWATEQQRIYAFSDDASVRHRSMSNALLPTRILLNPGQTHRHLASHRKTAGFDLEIVA